MSKNSKICRMFVSVVLVFVVAVRGLVVKGRDEPLAGLLRNINFKVPLGWMI